MSMKDSDWRDFMRRHWGVFAILVLLVVFAFIGAVYVFLWFVGNAQSSGMVPGTLGLWTMAHLVTFILHAIFWELVLIGIPTAIAASLAWVWWNRLPEEEQGGGRFGAPKRSAGSGGLSLLFFIAFCIKVFIDGKWNVPIATFTVNYVVGSMIAILAWGLIIFGIPLAIGLTWWISRELKKR